MEGQIVMDTTCVTLEFLKIQVFEKQTKMIENRGEKQVESPQSLKPNKQQIQAHQPQQQIKLLEDIFPKALLNNEV